MRLSYIALIVGFLSPGCAREDGRLGLTAKTWLMNERFAVESLNGDTVVLANGVFIDSTRHVRAELSDSVWLGDLNSDGRTDTIGLITVNSGGSGSFVELVAILDVEGKPRSLASFLLGDRVRVVAGAIESGKIRLEMLVHGNGEPMCCPTVRVSRTFLVADEKIVSADWPRKFQGLGTEPFWNIQITEEAIHFRSPDTTEQWKAVSPIQSGSQLLFLTEDESGNKISIVVLREKCSDGMSENEYAFRLTVERANQRLNGCARELPVAE